MTTVLEPHEAILKAIPRLRAFAISLTGDLDRADDLVQDALTKGLGHLHQFQPGTSVQAWLFTILRNQFHTSYRKKKREIEDPDGIIAEKVAIPPEQAGHLDLQDLRSALAKLPPKQREALLFVGAEGMSYEETARICGTNVGTIKSRINRARSRIADLMGLEGVEDAGPDRIVKAALQEGAD